MKRLFISVFYVVVLTACGSGGSDSSSSGTTTPTSKHKNVVFETPLNQQFQTDILNMDSTEQKSLDVENFAKTVTYLNDGFASFIVEVLNKQAENESEKYSSFHDVLKDLPSNENSFFLEIDQYNAMLVTIISNNASLGMYSIVVQADYDFVTEHPEIIETLNGKIKPDLLKRDKNTSIIFHYTLDETNQKIESSIGFNDYAYTVHIDQSSIFYNKTKRDLSGQSVTMMYDLNSKILNVNDNGVTSNFTYNEDTDSIE